MKRFYSFLVAAAFFFICTEVFSQSAKLSYTGSGGYYLVERANLRKYINGRYSGLTTREVRSFVSPSYAPDSHQAAMFRKDQWYDGNFYVVEETMRASREVGYGINSSIPSVFHISPEGKTTMYVDNGYPTFRSFPSYTTQAVSVGDQWKAQAERTVDPLNKGIFTHIPIHVLYTFDGEDIFHDEPVYKIKAIWQTNYGFSNLIRDYHGDEHLVKALGGHKADIIVKQSTGEAMVINDNVDETFFYDDGTQINFKGTIALFTDFPPAVNRNRLLNALQQIAKVDSGVTSKKSGDKSNEPAKAESGTTSNKQDGKGSDFSKSDSSSGDRKTSIAKNNSSSNANNSSSNANDSDKNDKNDKNAVKSSSDSRSGTSSFDETWEKIEDDFFQDTVANAPEAHKTQNSQGNSKIPSPKDNEKTSWRQEDRNSGKSADKTGDNEEPPKNNMVVEETPAGLRLSVRDIRFLPDSDQVVAAEKSRLDDIASVLKLAPDSHFLIEGHTASIGKPSGELTLSEQRAKRIAAELIKRGIPADKFICKGLGGTKPIATNSTEDGRAQNRRVEITILE